jgi:hypothetical protein
MYLWPTQSSTVAMPPKDMSNSKFGPCSYTKRKNHDCTGAYYGERDPRKEISFTQFVFAKMRSKLLRRHQALRTGSGLRWPLTSMRCQQIEGKDVNKTRHLQLHV